MNIVLRPMKPSDWDLVIEIYQHGMATNLATFERECPTYEQFNAAHRPFSRLVITADDVVVGWAALTPFSSRAVFVGVAEVSLYIHKDYHNLGLGSKLLDALILDSEKNGIWTLYSHIMQNNEASIHLHEKCGFRYIGYFENLGKDPLEQWRSTVFMERRSALPIF